MAYKSKNVDLLEEAITGEDVSLHDQLKVQALANLFANLSYQDIEYIEEQARKAAEGANVKYIRY